MSDVINTAEKLVTRAPRRIWGVSPESVYTALAAKTTGERLAKRLAPHRRAETLRTNNERDRTNLIEVHDWILEEFGLVDGGDPTLLGTFVLTSERPPPLLRAIAVARLESAETILRSCTDIEDSLPRREFDSLVADEWGETVLGPLLGSLEFVTVYPDSVEPSRDRIESALSASGGVSIETATSAAYAQILQHLINIEDEQCLEDLVRRVTGDSHRGGCTLEEVAEALARGTPASADPEEISDAVAAQREQYEQQFAELRSLLTSTDTVELDRIKTGSTIDADSLSHDGQLDEKGRELLANALATVADHPEFAEFDAEFLTPRLSLEPYEAYKLLTSIPGVECEVSRDDVIRFHSIPESIEGNDLREEYATHLVDRCTAVRRRIDALTDVSISSPPASAAELMVISDYESLNDGDVAPAFFTYTLVDPQALGERKMDDYSGDSRGLGRERARLRRWHENRPSRIKAYTAMTDRLFSLGLERELEEKKLRIMTPFDDDTFNEYVSQIRRLLEAGFELSLLTRHTKEPWEWGRLQENLLSEIKDHRERITVRTYSRFKTHQRVTPDMDFRDLGEFGIHGKVQTIGHPEEGAALLGSANFMENSYDWNPECGVYTERTQFVDTAVEFFDIVWDISAADELAIGRLQEPPNHQLVPNYYS